VIGLSQKFLTWAESDQFFMARVGPDRPSMVWVWKISHKNIKFFNFSLRVKKNLFGQVKWGSASYLLRVKIKLVSGPIATIFKISLNQFSNFHFQRGLNFPPERYCLVPSLKSYCSCIIFAPMVAMPMKSVGFKHQNQKMHTTLMYS